MLIDWRTKIYFVNRYALFGLSKKRLILLLFLYVIVAVLEIIGIASFVPLISTLRSEGSGLEWSIPSGLESLGLKKSLLSAFSQVSVEALILLSFFVFVIRQVVIYTNNVYKDVIKQDILKNIRVALFDGLLGSRFEYQEELKKGDLFNNFITEANTSVLFFIALLDLCCITCVLFIYFVTLTYISLEMILAALFLLLICGLVPIYWVRQSTVESRNLVNANRQIADFLLHRVRAIRLLNLGGDRASEIEVLGAKAEAVREAFIKNSRLQYKVDGVVEPLVLGCLLGLGYVGSTLGGLGWEAITLFMLLMIRTLPLFKSVIANFQRTNRYTGSVESILSMHDKFKLEAEIEPVTKIGSCEPPFTFRKMELRDVCFSYKSASCLALKSITVDILSGELIAIVGRSGSGKSTFADIIARLRSIDSGCINVDGRDFYQMSRTEWQKRVGYVPQDIELLGDSIVDHVSFGCTKELDPTRLIQSLKLAGLESLASDSKVAANISLGEAGVSLSGGQRQRLDFARVLYNESQLIILDEPGSALDRLTKSKVLRSVKIAAKELGKTVIMITHDLEDCLVADQVWLLEGGTLVCHGSHEFLLGNSDVYSQMWLSRSKNNS